MSSDTGLADAALITSLVDQASVRPKQITPRESICTRLVVLVLSPVWMAAIAAAVMLRLIRGRLPLIVMHERVGHAHVPLAVPKIATARVASNQRHFAGIVERASGPPVELDVDGAIERWLRETGADELPQLLLVLAGKMRLVGPRPVTPSEQAEMAETKTGQPNHEVGIDHLQPGIIGLWQVLDRHAYELDERRDLDIAMIDNWSPTLRRRLLVTAFRQAIARLSRR